MENRKFYRMLQVNDWQGIYIMTQTFVSIHETPCYYFCVDEESSFWVDRMRKEDETTYQAAKRLVRVYKIQKGCSRVAFETEELAFNNLVYRKRLRQRHLERDLSLTKEFLNKVDKKCYNDFENNHADNQRRLVLLPETKWLTSKFY